MPDGSFEDAWAEGARWDIDEAAQHALARAATLVEA